ncbi:MAG: transketolase [Deltaproteobacteria bacterium]|nr:transketolase [Deltaproteobacteria bacterium]
MTSNSRDAAKFIRDRILEMHRIGPNVGSALSIADIVAVLQFAVMTGVGNVGGDRLILSKGHGVSALYAALALRGTIPARQLENYMKDAGLPGHPTVGTAPGIEWTTGSLGHGLAVGAGIAWAMTRRGESGRVFVVLGDGECGEGTVWEAAALAGRMRMANLVAVVDANGWQGYDRVANVLPGDFIHRAFEAAAWTVTQCDGHDHAALTSAFEANADDSPRVVIARTIKGRGVPELEDRLESHYFSITPAMLDALRMDKDKSS